MTLDDLRKATAALPGPNISEVVLQTGRYDEMKRWYEAVLGQPWGFENIPATPPATLAPGEKQVRAVDVRACFMRLAPEFPFGMTFAIFEIPGTVDAPARDPGLNHMQFRNPDHDTLIRRVELLRDAGIHPQRSANHGHVLSFYFKDPDRNVVEFCAYNFPTAEAMAAFTRSEKFRKDPSGLELDRDAFLARYRSGESRETLLSI